MNDATKDEVALIESQFPDLRNGGWRKSGDSTISYNCIAWSLCNSNEWIDQMIDVNGNQNGKVDLDDMDKFYLLQGFSRCGSSISDCKPEMGKRKVALFCLNGEVKHASKEIGDNDLWESKLGRSIRITHRLEQLENGSYGAVCRCYCRTDAGANLNLKA